MKLKTMLTFWLVSFTAMGSVSAAKWTGKGDDSLWSTPANWDGEQVPGPTELVRLNPPPYQGPVLQDVAQCGEILGPVWDADEDQVVTVKGELKLLGRWRFANSGEGVGTVRIEGGRVRMQGPVHLADGGDTYGVVELSGGSLRCTDFTIGDGGGGELHVRKNGLVQVAGTLNLGGKRGEAPLKLTMESGLIDVDGQFRCPSNDRRAGKTTVRLEGGRLQCQSFFHADVPYTLDLREGELVVDGNVVSEINAEIEKGYITAYGGDGKAVCVYEEAADHTLVSAANRRIPWGARPANYASEVKPDQTLSWKAGTGAESYTVYLARDFQTVEKGAATAVAAKKVKEAEYHPELRFGQTYYWRVDTITSKGESRKGSIWRFETIDGLVEKGISPIDGASGVTVAPTLTWEASEVAESYDVYLGTDASRVRGASAPEEVMAGRRVETTQFDPGRLDRGKTYYWRVDAVNDRWAQSPFKGKVWSFRTDSGKARAPRPIDGAQWQSTELTLQWKAAPGTQSHRIYFADNRDAMAGESEPVRTGKKTTYTVKSLERGTRYYWRVDEVTEKGRVIRGRVWSFATEGLLDLKVDLAVPKWDNPEQPRPGTVKEGWVTWCAPRWRDMYMHDPVWLPPDEKESLDKYGNRFSREGGGNRNIGILASGVRAYINTGGLGKGNTGAVHAKGLCRGGLGGNKEPYGVVEGEPIANTYFYACDWAGPERGDVLLKLKNLPAGEYRLRSYHNFWEPTEQQRRNCRQAESNMPPMPAIRVVEGNGVTPLKNVKDVKVTSALKDDNVNTSVVKFKTDGTGNVRVVYEAPSRSYRDRARSGRPGGRGVLNAFELKRTVEK